MNQNPYSPPRANVADVEPVTPRTRPRAVVIATRLIWVALALDLLGSMLEGLEPDPEFSTGEILLMVLISMGVIVAIYVWLISAAWKGRSWARIVMLVLLILGFATNYFLAMIDPEAYDLPIHVSAIYWVSTLADVGALVLLFTPGANAWYRAMRGA